MAFVIRLLEDNNRNRNRELSGQLFGRLFNINCFFAPRSHTHGTPPPYFSSARQSAQYHIIVFYVARCTAHITWENGISCAIRHESLAYSVQLTGESAEQEPRKNACSRTASGACFVFPINKWKRASKTTQNSTRWRRIARGSVLLHRGIRMNSSSSLTRYQRESYA